MTDRREFTQLGRPMGDGAIVAGGWMSEKLDGMRAIWDGGITRGKLASEVGWYNGERDKGEVIATGLWSRLGKVIPAAGWWLNKLPVGVALDGELYMGKGTLETVMSVKRHSGRDESEGSGVWSEVTYMVFDLPSRSFLMDGEIVYDARTRKKCVISGVGSEGFVATGMRYGERYSRLRQVLDAGAGVTRLVEQTALSGVEGEARATVRRKAREVVGMGGEGVMVRTSGDLWVPKRVGTLLKVKPVNEGCGKVVGVQGGEGKHAGRMGALVVEWIGAGGTKKVVGIGTGFTDEEREKKWEVGETVDFKYTSLTADGVPREARYDRSDS